MSQQQTVETILHNLKHQLRNNTETTDKCHQEELLLGESELSSSQEELTIRRSCLVQYISQTIRNEQQTADLIISKDREIQALKQALRFAHQQLVISSQDNNQQRQSHKAEQFIKTDEMKFELEKEKKRRELLQKQIKWSQKKQKEQLMQIQKLKLTASSRELYLSNLQAQSSLNSTQQSHAKQDTGKQLQTPAKSNQQYLDPLTAFECITIQSKIRPPYSIALNHAKTQGSGSTNIANSSFSKNLSFQQQKKVLYRHSDLDKKQRVIRQLGQKCLYLQSYIQTLTRKLLGNLTSDIEPLNKPNIIVTCGRSESLQRGRSKTKVVKIDDEKQSFNVDID